MQSPRRLAFLVYGFILKTKIYHLFFWFVYVVLAALIIQPGNKPVQWVYYSAIILFFHASVAYFNNYILVNHFLYKRQYFTYLIALSLSIIAVGFPISIIFHSFVHEQNLKTFIWSTSFFLLNWASIFFTTLIVMALKLIVNWYSEEQENKHLQKLNAETELKFLKSQINPHFLFNALNNLYALTLKKSDDAPAVVLKLSSILRYVLYETGEGRVPLSKEISYLKDYVELEKIRLGNRVNITLNISGNLDNKLIEPMLFLTFVENSFKHGIAKQTGEAWLQLTLIASDEEISFEIANSTSKTDKEISAIPSTVGGIGLTNLKKRLDLIYSQKHLLEIFKLEEEFHVKLKLFN